MIKLAIKIIATAFILSLLICTGMSAKHNEDNILFKVCCAIVVGCFIIGLSMGTIAVFAYIWML